MSEDTKLARIEEQVRTMPSASQEAMAEIIRGIYAGKPLLGTGGLLTNLVKELPGCPSRRDGFSHTR